jgi:hypothetical protein
MKKSTLSWLWVLALFLLLAALIVLPRYVDLEPWTIQENLHG